MEHTIWIPHGACRGCHVPHACFSWIHISYIPHEQELHEKFTYDLYSLIFLSVWEKHKLSKFYFDDTLTIKRNFVNATNS